jgi:hypothetical protein
MDLRTGVNDVKRRKISLPGFELRPLCLAALSQYLYALIRLYTHYVLSFDLRYSHSFG